jgi:transposase
MNRYQAVEKNKKITACPYKLQRGIFVIRIETRKEIIAAHKRGAQVADICKVFGVKPRRVYALIQQERETGDITPKTYLRGRKPKVTPEQIEQMRQLLIADPDITVREMKEALALPLSLSTIRVIINKKL